VRITYQKRGLTPHRFGTLAFVVTVTLFQSESHCRDVRMAVAHSCTATAVPSCSALILGIGISYICAVPVTALLFLLRLRAVFLKDRVAVAIFGVLWFCMLGASISLPFAVTAARIGPTNYCIDAEVKPYSSAGPIANTIFSTIIFIAISWRLVSMSSGMRGTSRREAFLAGEGSSTIATALLRDGQMYYT
jgi:hypothetical protein